MKIKLNGPKGKDAILTIYDKSYRIEGFEGNLGYQIPFGLISNTICDTDFEIENMDDDLKVVSTDERLTVSFDGKITMYPVTKKEFAEAMSRDIRENAREWATPNASYKKEKMTVEEFDRYSSRFKSKEQEITDQLDWLDDLLADEPLYHTQEELEEFKRGF